MFDDPERYEHDGFYEEDTDYEDEYEADDSDYIVDDEENENALWDDEKKNPLTIFPKRSEGSGRTKLFLLTMIQIPKKPNYPNRSDGRLQKKNSSSKNWKPTPRNIPLRMVLTRKNWSVRSSNENCGQKPLHDWRIPPEHSGSLKM